MGEDGQADEEPTPRFVWGEGGAEQDLVGLWEEEEPDRFVDLSARDSTMGDSRDSEETDIEGLAVPHLGELLRKGSVSTRSVRGVH